MSAIPLRNTLVLATTVAVAATALGTALAWLVTRTNLPGRRVWRIVVPLPLVMPSFVGAFSLIAAFAPGGLVDSVVGFDRAPRIEGFWAAALVLTVLTYPYVYLPVAARLASLPRSLEESGRALGRGPRAVFRTVVLPQCTGAMWAGALLVFLYTLSEFGSVQLLHYETLTRAIFASWLFDRDVAMSLSLVLAVIALAVVIAERTVARRRAQHRSGRPGIGLGAERPRPVAVAGVRVRRRGDLHRTRRARARPGALDGARACSGTRASMRAGSSIRPSPPRCSVSRPRRSRCSSCCRSRS